MRRYRGTRRIVSESSPERAAYLTGATRFNSSLKCWTTMTSGRTAPSSGNLIITSLAGSPSGRGGLGPHLDVGRFEIAVNNPLLVRGFKRLGDLLREGQRLVQRHACLPRRHTRSAKAGDALRCDRSSPSTSSITNALTPPLCSSP